jgi:hypothetical protein
MSPMKLFVGDILRLRKVHPCGSFDWEVLRAGMDFRIRCQGCGRVVMLSRVDLEKSIKTVVSSVGKTDDTKPSN